MTDDIDANAKDFAEVVGYEVREDPDRPGSFLWRNGADGSDQSYATEAKAWDDAAFNAASEVMGHHDLDSEEWDGASHAARMDLAREMVGTTPTP